ncbi:hypothetical protein [Peptoniphilus raoultii]|nr:hypothetical protein [Peptoniphilus raoultii]
MSSKRELKIIAILTLPLTPYKNRVSKKGGKKFNNKTIKEKTSAINAKKFALASKKTNKVCKIEAIIIMLMSLNENNFFSMSSP